MGLGIGKTLKGLLLGWCSARSNFSMFMTEGKKVNQKKEPKKLNDEKTGFRG